jgi:hypothetical protein
MRFFEIILFFLPCAVFSTDQSFKRLRFDAVVVFAVVVLHCIKGKVVYLPNYLTFQDCRRHFPRFSIIFSALELSRDKKRWTLFKIKKIVENLIFFQERHLVTKYYQQMALYYSKRLWLYKFSFIKINKLSTYDGV